MKLELPRYWKKYISTYVKTHRYKKLCEFITHEYEHYTIFPQKNDIFEALELVDPDTVSVVILGQDPYHQPDQAHGLSFSVPENEPLPPSLKNIYKEIESDFAIKKDFTNGNLRNWANQGVLLLNSVLTVRANEPGSHARQGWEEFTDTIIKNISDKHDNIVFILWGNYAKKKGSIIDRSKHLVLESSHPSPLGAYRGFIGCRHFSRANRYLRKHNKKEIQW